MDLELLQAIEKMMDKMMDGKLEPIHKRLDSVESQLGELKDRVSAVEEKQDRMQGQLTAVEEKLTAMEEKQDLMNESIGVILEWADDVHTARDLPLPKIM